MLFDLNDIDSMDVVKEFLMTRRKKGKTVGLTSGCFDLVHFNHFGFFIRCRRYCDYLVVGVDSDELVRITKGIGRPVVSDFHRAIMVGALRPVSFVFIMNNVSDFGKASEILKPDVIFKNDEFKGREREIVGIENAGKVIILEDQAHFDSTSEIIACVSNKAKGN